MLVQIVDTGPLVSFVDTGDRHHTQCQDLLESVRRPWTTTIACLTEALHLVGRSGGQRAQATVLRLIRSEILVAEDLGSEGLLGAIDYMERFRDVPCDFADATLLVLAERSSAREIITLGRHFHAYRVDGRSLVVRP